VLLRCKKKENRSVRGVGLSSDVFSLLQGVSLLPSAFAYDLNERKKK